MKNFFSTIIGIISLSLILASCNQAATQNGTTTDTKESSSTTTNVSAGPDLTKLPLGDKKYSTSAKKGYIYMCNTRFDGGGAFAQGPWINSTAKTWDLTKKVSVDGNVSWSNATWKVSKDGETRMLVGNGLPVNHKTGTYPVASSDDAYQYDRNPNSIKSQTVNLSLPANPTVLGAAECVGGEVGIMLSGIPIFNGFDAGGRDAAAWEVQEVSWAVTSGRLHSL